MGQILAVMQFVTHFTHVSRHSGVQSRKQNENLGETVKKMWSQKSTRRTSFVPESTKIVNVFNVFFTLFLKVVLWTVRPFFFTFETKFSKQFFLKKIVLFSTVNSEMSRNMYKMCHKVCNGHFYPMKVHISSILNFFLQIKVLILILGFEKRIDIVYIVHIVNILYIVLGIWKIQLTN